jgi:hypothetical protein
MKSHIFALKLNCATEDGSWNDGIVKFHLSCFINFYVCVYIYIYIYGKEVSHNYN